MKTAKLFVSGSILAISALLGAQDGPAPAVRLATQFGRQEFTPCKPDAEELLRIFDLDKNGKITPDERENMVPILVGLMPKLKSDAERTRLAERIVKYWDSIPPHMSFYMDETWPILRPDFPPYATPTDPRLPESVEVLTNPKNKRMLVSTSKAFPPRVEKPKPSIVQQLDTPFQIKRRFDRDRNGKLSDVEVQNLLLELRFKFTLAKSNGARLKIVERYAEALEDFNADEFTVEWGMDSKFKIFKNRETGRWEADAKPLDPAPFGGHPSVNFIQKLNEKDPSGLALAEFLDMLQRTDPLKRAEIMAKELPARLSGEYPKGGTPEWKERVRNIGYGFANDGRQITEHDLERIIEYINERHENVFIPVFYTDSERAVDLLARISYENQKNMSAEERAALDAYYKSRK